MRRNEGLYFKSSKDVCISFNSKILNKCVVQKFIREIPNRIHEKEGHLEMTKIKHTFEIFHFWEILDQGRKSIRIRSLKFFLYFSIGKVIHHNEINVEKKILYIFCHLDRSPHYNETKVEKVSLFFHQQVGHPEQLNHLHRKFLYFLPSRLLKTIRSFTKNLFIFHQRTGHLK